MLAGLPSFWRKGLPQIFLSELLLCERELWHMCGIHKSQFAKSTNNLTCFILNATYFVQRSLCTRILRTISPLGTIPAHMLLSQDCQNSRELRQCPSIKGEGGSHLILKPCIHTGAHHPSASDPSVLHFCTCDLSRLLHPLLLLSLAHKADFQPAWGTGSSLRLSVALTAQRHYQVISFSGTCNLSGLCNEEQDSSLF